MRFSYFLLCLFCSSCFSGSNFPENAMIEINSIPPPFDINGRRAYVVWVNGKRVDLNQKEAIFQTEDSYLIMNFKNEIKETSEY